MKRYRKPLFIGTLLVIAVGICQAAPQEVASGVFFRTTEGGCNNGWVIFEDYVLVIDANFPQHAQEVVKEIQQTTDKPIRFVFDTHHHGDHAYGNNVFAESGAVAIAQRYCYEILLNSQDTFTQWAQGQPASVNTENKLPTMYFTTDMVYDDGNQRVELIHFGHGHTKGDAVAYLPKQKILFTGDLCVNGAYNYLGESNTKSWIDVLENLQGLDVEIVCPGHGGIAGKEVLETQRNYFIQLRGAVQQSLDEGKTLDEMIASIDIPLYQQWTGQPARPDHIRYVYQELTGSHIPWQIAELNLWEGPSPTRDTPGWSPPQKVVLRGVSERQIAELKHIAPDVEFINASNDQEMMKHIADADGALGPINPRLFDHAKNLRWVHSSSAGIEGYLFPEFVQSDTILTNGQGTYGPAMADHVMGFMLLFSKKFNQRHLKQLESQWDRASGDDLFELKDRTILILGLGGIGREVAKRAAGFGMRVLAVEPQKIEQPRYVTRIVPPSDMKKLLPQADFVVCCVPLTPHTRNYIDMECFDLMKDTAYFINVARGEVIVQDDLVKVLREGKLAGAALDVTDPEPLPSDHPLWKMENVIISPHMSGRTAESSERRWLLLRENIRRFTSGEPLLNVVDKEKGY